MSQHLDKELTHLIKKGRCISCKERDYLTYDCSRKKKIVAISKSFIKDNSSQGKN